MRNEKVRYPRQYVEDDLIDNYDNKARTNARPYMIQHQTHTFPLNFGVGVLARLDEFPYSILISHLLGRDADAGDLL